MKKIFMFCLITIMMLSTAFSFGCGGNTEKDNSLKDDGKDSSVIEDSSESKDSTDSEDSSDSEDDSGKEDSSENEDPNPPQPEKEELVINSPVSVTDFYTDDARDYLLSGSEADVSNYAKYGMIPYKCIYVKWKNTYKNVENFQVECSLNEDFSNSFVQIVDKRLNKAGFDNLLKGKTYYVKVTANLKGGVKQSSTASFKVDNIGPRIMKVDGIHNVRDVGGYVTENGKITKQGMIIRGGSLRPTADFDKHNITEEGRKYMSEVLKIKYEIDFRAPAEGGNLKESPIPGASMRCFGLNGYMGAFSPDKTPYKNVFKVFSDEQNYPVYMHCTAGADRTGTVAFILNALLGVSEEDLIHDYEFTSFSIYGERNTKKGELGSQFMTFVSKFKELDGNTLSQKAENYLLMIGLTPQEITNIKTIMTE